MAKTRKRSSKQKSKKFQFINFFNNSQSIGVISLFFISAILFVLLRMKAVDMGMELSKLNKAYEKVLTQSKELKAKKAGLLSTVNLRKLAKRHNLKEPKSSQIIVVD